jgi:hypothetical protein
MIINIGLLTYGFAENFMKKMGSAVFIFILVTLFLSCDLSKDYYETEQNHKKSNVPITSIYDNRLDELFSYHTDNPYLSYSEYFYFYSGTKKVNYEYKSDSLNYEFDYEFEINNGKFRKKLYENRFDDWDELVDIYFSSDNNYLYIKNKWYKKYKR